MKNEQYLSLGLTKQEVSSINGELILPPARFLLGSTYTRNDVKKILGIKTKRGVYERGYWEDPESSELFIFANIGIPGTTGHDYNNYWEGRFLRWEGNITSRLTNPLMKKLIDNDIPTHVFTRDVYKGIFTYQGVATAEEVKDITPVQIKWRFGKRLTRLSFQRKKAPKYWALLANPKRYRILDALDVLSVDNWTIGKSKVSAGDKVIIWQSLDHSKQRGIVALGEVLGDPEELSDQKNPFWIDEGDASVKKDRVPVGYVTSPKFPLWMGISGHNKFLQSLSVSRARGGTVFQVQEHQWTALMGILGGWPGLSKDALEAQITSQNRPPKSGGQGWGASPQNKKEIEKYSMAIAKEYFEREWTEVFDKSAGSSYDLLCRRDEEELYVEVKGTTTRGDSVMLTRNEVKLTREKPCALFVVSEIQLDKSNPNKPIASGGTCTLFKPWKAKDHVLDATQYQCKLNTELGKAVR